MPPVPLDRKKDFAKGMEPHLRCGSSGNSEILIFIESKGNLQRDVRGV